MGCDKKKKRKFKRRYLQPQPRKPRQRSRKHKNNTEQQTLSGSVKNFSGFSVTEVEDKLFARGKNFCPVELNPPFVRMQKELDAFFRILRIKWHFLDQQDTRSSLETKFYLKSDWMPPRACGELETFISQIQQKFDKWRPLDG